MEQKVESVWRKIMDLASVFSWSLILQVQYEEQIQFEDQILHPGHNSHGGKENQKDCKFHKLKKLLSGKR